MATQESTDHRQSQQGRIDRIEERIAELVDPRSTSEVEWVPVHVGPCLVGPVDPPWRHGTRCAACGLVMTKGCGSKLVSRPHVVEHPSLLEQLERAIGGKDGQAGSAGTFESKPAARIDALDTLVMIGRESRRLVEYVLHVHPSASAATNLRTFADRASTLTPRELRDLDYVVLSWWARARVTTGWDSPAWKPHVRCMSCDRFDTLRVRVAPLAAVCLACHAAWDSTTIGILGNHIQIALAAAIVVPDPVEVTA